MSPLYRKISEFLRIIGIERQENPLCFSSTKKNFCMKSIVIEALLVPNSEIEIRGGLPYVQN